MSRSGKTLRSMSRRSGSGRRKLLRAELLESRLLLSAVTLNADRDTYVRAGSYADSNFGNSTTLVVKNDTSANNIREAQLRFDMRQLGGTLTDAKLQLTAVSLGTSAASMTVRVRLASDASDAWVEGNGGSDNFPSGEVTWRNRATTAGAEVLVPGTAFKVNTPYSINVLPLLNQAALNGNALATFVIDMVSPVSTQRFVNFASREYSSVNLRPTLSVSEDNSAPTVAAPVTAAVSTVTTTSTGLAVLGADDGGEVNLTYAWRAVSGPANFTATTFTESGTNAAKNTTAIFPAAGLYTIEATITDTRGASVISSTNVSVIATASRINLTPPSTFVIPTAKQTFSATLVDQFGGGLPAPPTGFTWNATSGTITTAGVYTAPNVASAVPVTITATARISGVTYTGTATVTVGDYYGLRDGELATITKSLMADGAISRPDIIQILRAASSDDGLVNDVELSDLRTILKNATQFKIPAYVQVLAADVINGNAANGFFQGQPLGNLRAGSTAAQLNHLVDKWFLGADHPVTTNSYTYGNFSGQLFVTGAQYTDMKQGGLGDCYLIAALGSVAKSSATAIQNMFIDNGDGTWTVRFFNNGVADYVTVDRWLPVDTTGRLVYVNVGATSTNTSNELWLPLVEKAYTQWNETGRTRRSDSSNAYVAIEGGWTQEVCAQVLGRASSEYWKFDATTKQTLISAILANKAVTISTGLNPTDGLVGPHAYVATGYTASTDTFTLYNPWSFYHPGPLSLAQLAKNCQCFVIADPSGSTAAALVGVRPMSAVAPRADLRTSVDLVTDSAVVDLAHAAPSIPVDMRQDPLAEVFFIACKDALTEPFDAVAQVIPTLQTARSATKISAHAADVILRYEIERLI